MIKPRRLTMPDENRKEAKGHDNVADPTPANDQELAAAGEFNDETIPGVPNELVKEWREKYGKLFVIFHLRKPYVYRMLGYHEYKVLRKDVLEIMKNLPQGQQPQDDIFKEQALKKYVLWPRNFAKLMDDPNEKMEDGSSLPGGLPYVLGEYLVASSGFIEAEPFILE
jgi:hypothetical protein